MDVSPDGTTIAGGDTLGRVHLWDAATRELRDGTDEYTLTGGSVNSVAFDPAGDRVAAVNPQRYPGVDDVRWGGSPRPCDGQGRPGGLRSEW